jgi:hypothetical protein
MSVVSVAASANCDITDTGMMSWRPNDVFGIGFAYTGISDDASAFDRFGVTRASDRINPFVGVTKRF